MASGDTFEHGIYKDKRSKTGHAWYCPKTDWRFAISRAEVDNPFCYCPGCAVDVTDPGYDDVRSGCP